MFSYFRQATPIQWIGLLVVLLLTRLPLWYHGLPISYPELLQVKVGEQLNHGAMLYRDVWTKLPPLAGWLSGFLYWLGNGAHWPWVLAGTLLAIHQVVVFSNMSLRLDVFTERNLIPGLVYLVVISTVPDFMVASPALLSLSLLLPALARMARHLRVGVAEDEMFSTGLFLGGAALCFLPTAFLSLWLVVVYALYSGATFRHYMLLLIGLALPNVLVFLYWYWYGAGTEYFHSYISTLVGASNQLYLNAYQLIMMLLAPFLFWVLAILRIYSANRFINYQNVLQTVMLLWLVVGVLVLTITYQGSPQEALILLPPFAFMLTHYLQSFRRSFQTEILFWLMAGALFGTAYTCTLAPQWLEPNLPLVDLYARVPEKASSLGQVQNQKVLVLGYKPWPYLYNKAATPYIDTDLSLRHFQSLDEYGSVQALYANMYRDLPDLIVDQAKLLPAIFERIPALEKEYVPGPEPGTYRRKTVNLGK